ncbi:MAG: hypothetical protein ABFD77_11555 [Thermotogota bacterium]
MNKRRLSWIVGIAAVGLLLAGAVGLAGNGFGRGASNGTQTMPCQANLNADTACPANLDADGDGTPNGQDPDWGATCSRAGLGAALGGANCPASCPNAQASAGSGQGGARMQGSSRGCGGGGS